MMHTEATTNAGTTSVGQQYDAWATMTVASATSSAVVVAYRSGTNGVSTTVKPGSYIAVRKIA